MILIDVAVAMVAVATATAAALLAIAYFGVTRFGVLLVAGVIAAAALRGRTAGIAAAIPAVVIYYYLLEPGQTITVAPGDTINVVIFLIAALIVGGLSGSLRDHAQRSERQSSRLRIMFDTSRAMSAADDEKAIWSRLCDGLEPLSKRAILLDAEGEIRWSVGRSAERELLTQAHSAARDADENPAGMIDSLRLFPLRNSGEYLGALLWRPPLGSGEAADEEVVAILAEVAAASIGRFRLSKEMAHLEAKAEGERFRDILLSAVSHDFRSPLAAIVGSATSLLEYGDRFDATIRRDLLLNIQEEGERLNHFVENLLSWSRIRAGTLSLNPEPVGLVELAERVVRRLLGTQFTDRCGIEVEGGATARADAVLLEQVLFNLVDNALRYSGIEDKVAIRIGCAAEECRIDVVDEGPGMAQGKLSDLAKADSPGGPGGAGLGLTIARGLIEAQGGGLEIGPRLDGRRGLRASVSIPAYV